MKDVLPSPTHYGPMEFADVITALLMSTVLALLLPLLVLNATSELTSIPNFKNVCHALMDVLPVRHATIVLNADQTMLLIQRAVFVLKFAVMQKDTPPSAMMEITSMVMDAARIVELRLDFHASVVHQIQETLAALFCHLPYQFKTEVNQDYSERLF